MTIDSSDREIFRVLGEVAVKLSNTEADIHEIKGHLAKILEKQQQNQIEFLKIQKGLEEVPRVRNDVDTLRNNMVNNQKFIDNLNTRVEAVEAWKVRTENRENGISENLNKLLWQGIAIATFAAVGYGFAIFADGFIGKVRTIQNTPTNQLGELRPSPRPGN
jgi:regulator of replication initiation timing